VVLGGLHQALLDMAGIVLPDTEILHLRACELREGFQHRSVGIEDLSGAKRAIARPYHLIASRDDGDR